MKNLKLIIALLLFAQFSNINAQDCSDLLVLREGSEFTITNYNKKGKVEGSTDMKVSGITRTDAGINSIMSLKAYDEKKKEVLNSGDFNFECADGILSFDMSPFMKALGAQMPNTEVAMTGDLIQYPNQIAEGQELKEVKSTISVGTEGFLMSMEIGIVNRTVKKKETITVEAGTFECIHVSYDVKIKVAGIDNMTPAEEWYSPELGMVVKSIIYNRAGKVTGSTELTRLVKK